MSAPNIHEIRCDSCVLGNAYMEKCRSRPPQSGRIVAHSGITTRLAASRLRSTSTSSRLSFHWDCATRDSKLGLEDREGCLGVFGDGITTPASRRPELTVRCPTYAAQAEG